MNRFLGIFTAQVSVLLLSALVCQGQVKTENTSISEGRASKICEIDVAGHAHMDMDWLWTYDETIKMADDNLRQMVAFLEEYPDFKTVQSQAAVYQFVEKTDPELFKKVVKFVKEGRLEPVGGSWVESDNVLSSGEALCRSFLLGQTYFLDHFGRSATVGWFPDDFGHNSQLPQMLNLAGMKYYYFMRCAPVFGSFLWEGSDGSQVIAFKSETYNGIPDKASAGYLEGYPAGGGKTFLPIGVGDHGGGPSRAYIDSVHALDSNPAFPAKMKFTTAEEFFKSIEPSMSERPKHTGEMQFIFEGCYTNVAEVKDFNRRCENTLYENEMFNSLDWLCGEVYPSDLLNELWRSVAFNEFHDILPGSAIYESNRENVARYEETWRKAKENRDIAFWKFTDKIKFQKGIGQPVVAFNLQPVERKAIVEAEVFSYDPPSSSSLSSWGDFYGGKSISPRDGLDMSVTVRDADGNTYPAQIIEGKMFPPGWRSKVQFVVDKMPAGYKTFYVDVSKPDPEVMSVPCKDGVFTTDYFQTSFNPATGDIISLVDKKTGKQYVAEGKSLNTLRIYLETKDGGMKSWMINNADSFSDACTVPESVKITNGPERAKIESDKVWGKSKFHVRTYIYKAYPRIDFDVDIDWLEWGNEEQDSPMLRAVFSIAMDTSARLFCHTQFDVVERPANGKFNGGPVPEWLDNNESLLHVKTTETKLGQEVPAQFFSDVNDGCVGFAILNNSKYGYSYDAGEFRLSLMRSGGYPDLYPNLGRFNVRYSIYPHEGDWAKANVLLEGEAFNNPVYAAEPRSASLDVGGKKAPEEAALFSVDSGNVQLTAIKKSQKGKRLVIRFAEMEGKETTLTLTLPVKIRKASRLDLIERELSGASDPSVKGNKVTVSVRPHEIVTLGLKVKKMK